VPLSKGVGVSPAIFPTCFPLRKSRQPKNSVVSIQALLIPNARSEYNWRTCSDTGLFSSRSIRRRSDSSSWIRFVKYWYSPR
jgi:hypothetical protein